MSNSHASDCSTATQVTVQRTASFSQEDEAHQPELTSGPSRRREERSQMSDIVENDIVFRAPADFAQDAERRQWLESREGQGALEAERIWHERLHQAVMIVSPEYAEGQAILEKLLRGEAAAAADFANMSLISATRAMKNHMIAVKANEAI